LTLNNTVIISRTNDNYINATQLCQAGNKKFNDWFRLDTSKELINVLESKAGIPALELVEINKGGKHLGSWIHPKLAIQLAQWISTDFALQVSDWILDLLTIGKVEINESIKNKDKKIKMLEDLCVKKHKRVEYPGTYVIYMLTTEEHKKNRTYIICKATNLKDRLGSYNKTCDHEVVYYKECNHENDMKMIEEMVLKKLDKYREKANRDRLILPIGKNISLFKSVIDDAIDFFD
jgi:hypothetical protein